MKEEHLITQQGNEVSKANLLPTSDAPNCRSEIEQRSRERELKAQSFIEQDQQSTYSKVEDYLLEGGSLTVLECWNKFHTTELRKVVSRINKRHGCKFVQSEWVQFNGKRFKRYHL